MGKYEHLLEPSMIGPVKTRNRIIKTGASLFYWNDNDTKMNKVILSYYEAIARGGVGLLIVESPIVDYPLGGRWSQRYRLDQDKYINGISELVKTIHKHGCPAFMQMNHDGPWQSPLFVNYPATFKGKPIAASPVNLDNPGDFHRDVPRALKKSEIEDIVNKFVSAAVRAQKAGFDGIDINAASSHLLHNFLSPFWNRRKDAYGGPLENRAKFVLDIVKEIKNRCGRDFPVSVCINALEVGQAIGIPNSECITFEDAKRTAQLLEAAGADMIHVRSHWLGHHAAGFLPDLLFYPEPPVPLKEFPMEYFWKGSGKSANKLMAKGIKDSVSIPVMVVGRITFEDGDKILKHGMADFIAINRAFNADPDFPNKLASGREEEIAPCTSCLTCLDQSVQPQRRCRINARLSRDKIDIEKTYKRKKVLVVGGGPTAMEAARVAAIRGHKVTLIEKTRKLGGLIPLAAVVKSVDFEDLPSMVRYYKIQLKKLGVKVKLGIEVTPDLIKKMKPDTVIIGAGGILASPDIPGIDKSIVINNEFLHRMLKLGLTFFSPRLINWATKIFLPFIGKRVVVIGGEMHGFELAEFLVKRGRKVTIVSEGEVNGKGMVDVLCGTLAVWLEQKGVQMIPHVKSMDITDNGINIVTEKNKKQFIEADSIVIGMPSEPNTALFESIKNIVGEAYMIGDCDNPNMIVDAVAAGWLTANKV